jgi:hypothetical protein
MSKLTVELTEQDFIYLMNTKDLYGGKFSNKGLKLLFKHFSQSTDATTMNKIKIWKEWTEYESRQDAENYYLDVMNGHYLDDFTDILTGDNGIVVVKDF